MTGDNLEYLTAFFNSRLFKFAFKEYFPELLGDTRELRKVFFETIPLKPCSDNAWFREIVEQITLAKRAGQPTSKLESQIDDRIFDIYELTTSERELICGATDDVPELSNILSASES